MAVAAPAIRVRPKRHWGVFSFSLKRKYEAASTTKGIASRAMAGIVAPILFIAE